MTDPIKPEFKLVTILFADIFGSTALGERMGPEVARVILSRCLGRMGQAVQEYGGTVARLMGDGLLAFFGAPISREDDAERAALASMRIQTAIKNYAIELGERLEVRVGINTGRVVMGEVGGEAFSEYTAMGTPIVMAQRLESVAQPGQTLIGETTARLIRHRFDLDSLPGLELKGFEGRVSAYALLSERPDSASARGFADLSSPLVGRDREQEQLADRIQALEAGRGGIISIIGEPGIGKSRLLIDARERFAGRDIRWAEGRAYSYTEDQPFSIILDLLTELLGLEPDDMPAMMDIKLDLTLRPLLDESELAQTWPFLANLLGSPMPPQYANALKDLDPQALVARTTQGIQLLVERMAARQAFVLSFEDLHWADPSSLNLIDSLLFSSETSPLLLVLLFRAEREKGCWDLKIKAETQFPHRYLELVLNPLDDDSSQSLIENLLDVARFPVSLKNLILEKSEGNPFFVEELIRELIDRQVLVQRDGTWNLAQDVDGLEIPETLEKVIQARLDRLTTSERTTLQAASVIGRRFAYRILEVLAASGADLTKQLLRLQQTDLVRERARLPELEYIFKHVIVQEVTYRTLLTDQRRQLHRQVAETIERLFFERRGELLGTLARHYAAAGENERAIELYEMAGNRARDIFAYEEALNFINIALELRTPNGHKGEALGLLEQKADLLGLLGREAEAIELYRSIREMWVTRKIDEPWIEIRLYRKIIEGVNGLKVHVQRMEHETIAHACIQAGKAILGGMKPHPESARLLIAAADLHGQFFSGPPDYEAAQNNVEEALAVLEHLDEPVIKSSALGTACDVLFSTGRYRQFHETCTQRLRLSRDPEFNDIRERAKILQQMGVSHRILGEYGPALKYLEEAEAIARQINDIALQALAYGEQAEIHYRLDRWEEVLQIEGSLLMLQSRYGLSRAGPLCFFFGLISSVYALQGKLETSLKFRDEAYEIMIESGGGTEAKWIRNQHY